MVITTNSRCIIFTFACKENEGHANVTCNSAKTYMKLLLVIITECKCTQTY